MSAFRHCGTDREEGRIHELLDHLPACHRVQEMAGPDSHPVLRNVQRIEERQAINVIVVAMGEQDIDVTDPFFAERHAGGVCSRSGIKDQHPLAAPHFHAAGVAADLNVRRQGCGHTAPDAPET